MTEQSVLVLFWGTQILIVASVAYVLWKKISGSKTGPTTWFGKSLKDAFWVLIAIEILYWVGMFILNGGNLDDTLDGYTYLWGITHFTGIVLIPSVLTFLIMAPIRSMRSRRQSS